MESNEATNKTTPDVTNEFAVKSNRKPSTSKPRSTAKQAPAKKSATSAAKVPSARSTQNSARFPRNPLCKSLKIPTAILEQNAGKDCTDVDAAEYISRKLTGEVAVEISSAIKFGFLERPAAKQLRLTDLAKRILRPHKPSDKLEGLREAVLKAPDIAEVYSHYRGENLPDKQFFDNALVDMFKIPQPMLEEFKSVFFESLRDASMIEEHDNGKNRVFDISQDIPYRDDSANRQSFDRLLKSSHINSSDTCFVVMPFALPLGGYYQQVYEPAIRKAGLQPVRADDDIFATGKIIDQVWKGINQAKVLVAELTTRNPNVYYELGLAHALKKPVVLISLNENDVPFDVRHIRVIYYDVNDPFWGEKLISKVAENIVSAINHPEEALFPAPS